MGLTAPLQKARWMRALQPIRRNWQLLVRFGEFWRVLQVRYRDAISLSRAQLPSQRLSPSCVLGLKVHTFAHSDFETRI